MTRPHWLIVGALAALGLLAACGESATVTPVLPTPIPTIAPTTAPTPAPTQVLLPTAVALPVSGPITFEESGGIAGVHRILHTDASGNVVVTDDRGVPVANWTIPADQWAALLAQATAVDFAHLQSHYDQGNVADDIYWTVAVQQGGRTQSVLVAAAGGDTITPAPLKALIQQLRDLATTVRAEGTALPTATPAPPTPLTAVPTELMPPPMPTTPVPQTGDGTPLPGSPITFVESGGVGGIRHTLSIDAAGNATVTDFRGVPAATWPIPADQWATLQAQVAAADFAHLQPRYDQGNVADDIYLTVTVQQDGQTRSVVVAQVGGAQITPAPLNALLTTLLALAKTTAEQGTPLPSPTPSATAPPTPAPPTVPLTSAPTLPPTPVGGTPQPGSSITFLESGTIAGIRRTLTVDSVGNATVTDNYGTPSATWRIPADRWASLQAQIAAADFAHLQAKYDQGNVADDIYWTVTVQQGWLARSVFAAGAGGDAITPAPLKALIATLRDLAKAVQTQGTPLPTPTPVPTKPRPTAPPTVAPTTPPSPSPVSGTPQPGSPITFLESGTIAGIHRTLTVDNVGNATVTDNYGTPSAAWRVPADQWAALQAQIAAADFAHLQAKYDQGNVADDIYWTVTVQEGTHSRQVFVAGAGGDAITPAPLKDLIATLRDLARAVQTQGTPLPTPTPGSGG